MNCEALTGCGDEFLVESKCHERFGELPEVVFKRARYRFNFVLAARLHQVQLIRLLRV